MKRSISLSLLIIGVITAMVLAPAHASYSSVAYAWTDKASYLPGDSGTLSVTVLNSGTVDFSVKNVSITFPWKAFLVNHWDGNITDTTINQALGQGQAFNKQYAFTVPTDGRVNTLSGGASAIQVVVGVNVGTGSVQTTAPISIAQATYQPVSLTTYALPVASTAIFAVAVVLLALIFLEVRKPTKK